MKDIKILSKHIREELQDAENYAKLALHYKDDDRSLSQAFEKLAGQELDHADILHAQATRLIKHKKETGIEPPVSMLAVWNWEHENMIECVAKIKLLLSEL